MKKILILYFSGVGSTKEVAKLMASCLVPNNKIQLSTLENNAKLDPNDYDALIIGTPVYHGAPSNVVTDYFDSINPLIKEIPAFIFNTRATWSCHTNRILAKQLKKKNIMTIMDSEYRSPASDGSLILPVVKRFFDFEKELQKKIIFDCSLFLKLLQQDTPVGYIPRFRFSSILNAPNKLAGQLIIFTVHLHSEKCIKCNKCIKNCPHKALKKAPTNYPVFIKKNCENCYRCIHHCPMKALSLCKRHTPEKLLSFKD